MKDASLAAKDIGHCFILSCKVQESFTGLINVYFGAKFKDGCTVFETTKRLCNPPMDKTCEMRLLNETTGKIEGAEVLESVDKAKVLAFLGR